MNPIEKDIEFFNKIQAQFESGKWVLIHDQKLISVHDDFEQAAEEAVKLFSEGPYLIRQVGAPPVVMPASVVYRFLQDA